MKHTLLFILFIICCATAGYSQSAKGAGNVDLMIFPNPATEFIAVNDEDEIVTEIVIYNLVGKKVRVFEATPNERFAVGDLPKGMYLVQLIDSNQKIINTQKVNKK
jgi:hypothetical protein